MINFTNKSLVEEYSQLEDQIDTFYPGVEKRFYRLILFIAKLLLIRTISR